MDLQYKKSNKFSSNGVSSSATISMIAEVKWSVYFPYTPLGCEFESPGKAVERVTNFHSVFFIFSTPTISTKMKLTGF